mgnify:CR=1 FL=1
MKSVLIVIIVKNEEKYITKPRFEIIRLFGKPHEQIPKQDEIDPLSRKDIIYIYNNMSGVKKLILHLGYNPKIRDYWVEKVE